MRANTAIGEMLIHANVNGEGRSYLLRPSFLALSQLGEPEYIKSCFERIIMAMNVILYGARFCGTNQVSHDQLNACIRWIECCCQEEMPDELLGWFQLSRNQDKMLYRAGALSVREIVVLADGLFRHAMIGKPKRKPKKSSDGNGLFDPSDFVGVAISQLGLPKDDAWNLTMTEFQRAIDAKFPVDKKKEPIEQDELDSLLEKSKAAHDKLPKERRSRSGRSGRY